MESPFALLLVAVMNRIKSVQINGAQAIPWIDQDMMQLESHNGDDRPPVTWPAGTVDIGEFKADNMGFNAQKGTVVVIVRLGFPPFTSSAMAVPAHYRNKSLYYYDLEDAVHKALHGWYPGTVIIEDGSSSSPAITADLSSTFGPLTRMTAATERRNDRIRVRELRYLVSMDDYSTMELPDSISATFTISPSIE